MIESSPPEPAESRPEVSAFLQDIKSRPDDDDPRLVLADWLQENGDPVEAARGEMLRIQVLLTQMHDTDPRRVALRRRQGELVREYLDVWVGELADHAAWRFERGFLHLEARAAKFLRRAVAALATPDVCDWVETLKLEGLRPRHLPRLARCPFLPHVHTLDLADSRLPGDELEVLVGSPGVSRLRALFLDGNRIGPAGARAIAASPHLAGLTTLDLAGNRVGDEGARCLADSPHLDNLTSLWVQGNGLGKEGRSTLRKRFGDGVNFRDERRPAAE